MALSFLAALQFGFNTALGDGNRAVTAQLSGTSKARVYSFLDGKTIEAHDS